MTVWPALVARNERIIVCSVREYQSVMRICCKHYKNMRCRLFKYLIQDCNDVNGDCEVCRISCSVNVKCNKTCYEQQKMSYILLEREIVISHRWPKKMECLTPRGGFSARGKIFRGLKFQPEGLYIPFFSVEVWILLFAWARQKAEFPLFGNCFLHFDQVGLSWKYAYLNSRWKLQRYKFIFFLFASHWPLTCSLSRGGEIVAHGSAGAKTRWKTICRFVIYVLYCCEGELSDKVNWLLVVVVGSLMWLLLMIDDEKEFPHTSISLCLLLPRWCCIVYSGAWRPWSAPLALQNWCADCCHGLSGASNVLILGCCFLLRFLGCLFAFDDDIGDIFTLMWFVVS